jgi:hypothetical protein
MFYMLASVHQRVATGKAFPPPHHFWHYFFDLPLGIRSAAESFQIKLEHLVICEAPLSPVLSGVAGVDAPSLCAFFATLQRGDTLPDTAPCERRCVGREAPHEGTHCTTPPDWGTDCPSDHPEVGADRLKEE